MIQNKITQYQETKLHLLFISQSPRCEMCGHRGQDLVVHHILKKGRYPEYRYFYKNWAILCCKCHLMTEAGGIYQGVKMTAKQFNDLIKNRHGINPETNKFNYHIC